MADGYRFPQQSAGNYYFPQHNQPRHQILRNGTPPNNIRTPFTTDTPSPSRSPDSNSPAHSIYGMFNQSHQQGQHGRVNGGTGGRGMPNMMYNFQHQNQQQAHHPSLQQDSNAHPTNGLGHHSSYSSGVLSNATPSFTPTGLQNGHSGLTRGGEAQSISKHWADQLKLHQESQSAHRSMLENHAPHHFARIKAGENRGIAQSVSTGAGPPPDAESENHGRTSNRPDFIKRQDWNNLDLSGLGLKVVAPTLFHYDFLNELYIASNKLTQLPASIGQLRHLTLLDASNNQLSQLPPELGMCVFLVNLLFFDNNVHTIPNELGSLYKLEMLGIEGNPFDQEMKKQIMEHGTKSLILKLREETPVPLPPNERPIINLIEGAPASTNQERFKVLSYNILCDNATRSQYDYTPSEALAWDFRKKSILDEILKSDADIICLQEVDIDSFEEFFRMELAYKDYKGVFWPKPRANTMSEKDRKVVDGCATFFKQSKYILLDKQLIDFVQLAITRPDMKGEQAVYNRVMPKDHIAVLTFLENRLTGSRLIVANGHLFWDAKFPDVKLIQTALLLDSITKYSEKYARWPACKNKTRYRIADEEAGSDTPTDVEPAPSMEYTSSSQLPLVMCVDLNSTPDSSVYELLSKGRIEKDHVDLSEHSYGNFTRDGIEHQFSLRSAYSCLDDTPEKLAFTNYTPGFIGVIDHIFYSTNALELTTLLGGVDAEYMKRVPGFPNYHFPSDHLSLFAEFAVKGRKEKKQHAEPDFGPSSRR